MLMYSTVSNISLFQHLTNISEKNVVVAVNMQLWISLYLMEYKTFVWLYYYFFLLRVRISELERRHYVAVIFHA